jgi:hypothetical protein
MAASGAKAEAMDDDACDSFVAFGDGSVFGASANGFPSHVDGTTATGSSHVAESTTPCPE